MALTENCEPVLAVSTPKARPVHPRFAPRQPIGFNRQITIDPNLVDEAWVSLTVNVAAETLLTRPRQLHAGFMAALSHSATLNKLFG